MVKKLYASEENTSFFIIDSKNFDIVYMNDAFIKYLGYENYSEVSKLLKNDFSNLLNDDGLKKLECNFDTSIISLKLKSKEEALLTTNLVVKTLKIKNNELIFGYIKQKNSKNLTYDFTYEEGKPTESRFLEFVSRSIAINRMYDFDKYALLYLSLNLENLKLTKDENYSKIYFSEDLKNIFNTSFVSKVGDSNFLIYAKDLTLYAKIYHLNDDINKRTGYNSLNFKVGIYKINNNQSTLQMVKSAKETCKIIQNHDQVIYKYYNEEILSEQKIYEYVTNNLEKAINENEIEVFYQPVVRTINNTLCSVEALSRWNTQEFGLLPPSSFIGPLEDTKQIEKLDTYVFELICKDLRNKLDNNLEYVPISFNLSRLDFVLMDPFQMVLKTTNKYDIPHKLIKIEITETVVMSNPDSIKNIISKFKSEGFEIWMDDFGSAYSSLNMLKEFELDEIKLDLVFLKNLNEKSKIIIKNIISMAKNLGIQTLCEGVETKEQFDFLKSIGCEKAQGYLFSKPERFSDMINAIKGKKIEIEKPKYRDYFKKLSNINFQTDLSICLMNVSNKAVSIYYLNEACKKILAIANINNEKEFENKINSSDVNLKQKLLSFKTKTNFIHLINGHLFKVSAKNLSNYEDDYLYLLNIELLNAQEVDKVSNFDKTIREISQVFQSMVCLDFNNDKFDIISAENCIIDETIVSLNEGIQKIKNYIYVSDLKKFDQFFNVDTLNKKIENDKENYVSEIFRFYKDTKEIVRTNVIIILISREEKKYLLVARNLTIDEEIKLNDITKILRAREDILNVSKDQISSYDMFISIIKSGLGNYYFKDNNHRFLGASDKFLELIEIQQISQIIGFKDVELGLNVSNNKLYQLEHNVLVNNVEIKNEKINFIKNGKMLEVTLNIFPIYENKKIKGLFAEIIDLNSFNTDNEHVLNYNQFIDTYLKYYDQYKYYDEYFVTYKIELNKLDEVKKTLGIEFVKKIESAVLQKLINKFGNVTSIAHIGYGKFMVIRNLIDNDSVETLKKDLFNTIFNLKSIDNVEITIFNKIETYICNDKVDENIEYILKTLEV